MEFVVSTNSTSSIEGQFQWDPEILEFLDTIEYYGHEATVHLLRGPGFYKTAEEHKADKHKFDWSTWNWPLPGRTTRHKGSKGRYATDSGIYWPLVQNFLSIISDANSGIVPIFLNQESKLKLFGVSLQEDGIALKPGLYVDSHQAKVIGATVPIGLQFTRDNPSPTAEELKKILVKEAHCLCVETLDAKIAIPVGVHYLSSEVNGEEQLEKSMSAVSCIQTCLSCLKDSKMEFQGAVLKGQGHCQSGCQNCISQGEVCTECSGRHKFVHPALRACNECLEKDQECVKMVCLAWLMDSESKNKNSQIILTKRQSDTESTTDADLVTAFPDPVHVAKNDRASFANWYRLVDGYRVNLVLLRTARTDPVLKEVLLPHLSLAACRNRDRMDVDTVVEICSPEVRKGLQRVNWIVQTLVPEVYRLYDGNKEGVLKSPVSVCPASWGTLLVADKEKGKILSARLHYPVDVVEVVTGLSCPVAITYSHGLLLIADVGKQRIVCSDLTGDHFLNPDKMTVKQLRKALKDRQLLPPGNNSKKGELQKALKSWMDANSSNDRDGQTKLHTVEIVNKPTIQATAVVFSEQGTDKFYAAEMSGEVHEISLTINGLKATADVLRSIDVKDGSLFGIVRTKRDSELYVSSSADNGGLFKVNFATGHSECLVSNGSEDLQRIHGICAKMDWTVVMVDRGDLKVKEFKGDLNNVTVLAGSGRSGTKDGSEQAPAFLNRLLFVVKKVLIQFMY